MKKYKLYVFPLTEQTITFAEGQRFSRITKDYILVYSEGNFGDGKEVTENDLHRLSRADADWLRDCNFALIFEETKKKESELVQVLGEQIEQLEQALKEEGEVNNNEQ